MACGGKEVTIFKETGAYDTLLHWTRVLLCSLHHLKCPHYKSAWHNIPAFSSTTEPSRSLFCVLSFAAQNCPEAASEAPEPPAAPSVGVLYSPAHYGQNVAEFTLKASLTPHQFHLFIQSTLELEGTFLFLNHQFHSSNWFADPQSNFKAKIFFFLKRKHCDPDKLSNSSSWLDNDIHKSMYDPGLLMLGFKMTSCNLINLKKNVY